MPTPPDVVAIVNLNLSLSIDGRELWVAIGDEGHGHDRFVLAFNHVRALADALNAEIAANPELFPLTHTRLVDDVRGM